MSLFRSRSPLAFSPPLVACSSLAEAPQANPARRADLLPAETLGSVGRGGAWRVGGRDAERQGSAAEGWGRVMVDELREERDERQRAGTSADREILDTVKRADISLQVVVRWVGAIVLVIGFGIAIGKLLNTAAAVAGKVDSVDGKVDRLFLKVDDLKESTYQTRAELKVIQDWKTKKDEEDRLRDLKVENLEVDKRAREIAAKKGE